MKHKTFIAIYGYLWFFIGSMLLIKGLGFISQSILEENSYPVMLGGHLGSVQWGMFSWILIACLVGFFKGRFVLSKTAKKMIQRVEGLPLPISFLQGFGIRFFLIIFLMMGMGHLIKASPISFALRGFIDVAIGSALLNGSLVYFKRLKESHTSDTYL